MKGLLTGLFILICSYSFGQTTYYAQKTGLWSDNTVWNTSPDGTGTAGVPGPSDIAYTEGYNIFIYSSDAYVGNLFVQDNVANQIQNGGTTERSLTINGQLSGYTFAELFPGGPISRQPAAPTTSVFADDPNLNVIFTGDNAVANEIANWSHTAPINTVIINAETTSNIIQIEDLAIINSLTVVDGTLVIKSPFTLVDNSGSAVLDINSTGNLTVNGGINGGSNTTRFNTVIINGSATTGTSGYINSINFTLNANSELVINFNGSNQTQGWWYQSTEPTGTVAINTSSTITYGSAVDQNIGARSYGNLILDAGASGVTKTISGLGNFIVKGDFIVNSPAITFSSTNASANLDFQGDIINDGTWGSFSNTSFRFTGATSQIISGGAPINIPINLVSNNSSGVTWSTGAIFDGTTTISGTATSALTLDDITIASASTLTGPTGSYNISGNFDNNGIYNHNNGTVTFNGTSDITTGSIVTFFNIAANGTLTNNGDVTLMETMSFNSSANVDYDGDGSGVFLIPSTTDQTTEARIASVPTGAVVTGVINVERFMAGENRIWRYLAAPADNVTVAEWQSAEFPITGSFTGAGPAGTVGGQPVDESSPSMYYYNESATGNLSQGYVEYPVDENTEVIVPGEGYAVFQRQGSSPVTLLSAGEIITGTFNFPTVTYNAHTADPLANDGWNLVGNPYPSPIDWASSTGWTKIGLTGTAYVKNNGASGDFYEHTGPGGEGTGPGDGWNGHIAIGQAFWVQATATPTFRVNEAAKVADAEFYRVEGPTDNFRVFLSTDVNENYADDILLSFTENGQLEYQPGVDAYKMEGDFINFSFLTSDEFAVAINAVPQIECTTTIPMFINPENPNGSYFMNFAGWETLTRDVDVQLVDAFTNEVITLSAETEYEFIKTDDPATYGADRFSLIFNTNAVDISGVSVETPAVCTGDAGVVKLTNAQQGVQYAVEVNNTPIDSATAEGGELDIEVPAEHLTGTVDVVIRASNGCDTDVVLPETYQIVVNNLPSKPAVDEGSTCGSGAVTLVASGANDGEFRWYTSNADTAEPIEGAVNSEFTTPELKKTKDYYVSIVNASGCESARSLITAAVKEKPAPEITQVDEFTLVSNYDQGNQWYFNDELIPDATGKELEISQSGTYTLEVTQNGCAARTDVTLEVTALDEKLEEWGIEIFPNPVEDVLQINTGRLKNPHMQITTVNGRVKYVQNLKEGVNQINVSKLDNGLYLIKIRGRNDQFVLRLIKK